MAFRLEANSGLRPTLPAPNGQHGAAGLGMQHHGCTEAVLPWVVSTDPLQIVMPDRSDVPELWRPDFTTFGIFARSRSMRSTVGLRSWLGYAKRLGFQNREGWPSGLRHRS